MNNLTFESLKGTNPDFFFNDLSEDEDFVKTLSKKEQAWLDLFENDRSEMDARFEIYEKVWLERHNCFFAAVVVAANFNYNQGKQKYDLRVCSYLKEPDNPHFQAYVRFVDELELRKVNDLPDQVLKCKSENSMNSFYYAFVGKAEKVLVDISDCLEEPTRFRDIEILNLKKAIDPLWGCDKQIILDLTNFAVFRQSMKNATLHLKFPSIPVSLTADEIKERIAFRGKAVDCEYFEDFFL